MTQQDTAILAVHAKNAGLTSCPKKAATILRSANNAALAARYGDKAVNLRNITFDLENAQKALTKGITSHAGKRDDLATKNYVKRIGDTFVYQCSEGDCESLKSYKFLLSIVQSLE